MAIIYNWVVSSMDEYPTTSNNLTDVVFNVYWRRNATEIVGEKNYFVDTFGMLYVPAPAPANFTPYADLTFEQVCGWLEAGLNTEEIDAGLAVQLQNLINPPVVSLPLPWAPQPEPTPEPTPKPIIEE
jgi:hypothetical protein